MAEEGGTYKGAPTAVVREAIDVKVGEIGTNRRGKRRQKPGFRAGLLGHTITLVEGQGRQDSERWPAGVDSCTGGQAIQDRKRRGIIVC